jgi:hypothetical protein
MRKNLMSITPEKEEDILVFEKDNVVEEENEAEEEERENLIVSRYRQFQVIAIFQLYNLSPTTREFFPYSV